MPCKENRSSEHDIAFAALKYLNTLPDKTAPTSDVKLNIPDFIDLTPEDREISETRPNEELWQQVVGNIVSHRKDSPENFINQGLINYDGKNWTLTESGIAYLTMRNV